MTGLSALLGLLSAANLFAQTQACAPEFPYQQGWLGGDAAYSVAISSAKTVWLFGDTFVGHAGQNARPGSRMISNSIAVSNCSGGRWTIDYRWKPRLFRSPRAFFESGAGDEKLWPLDGFMHEGRLYLMLSQIRSTPQKGLFGFESVGVLLARIDDPQDDPNRWSIHYLPLASGKVVFPGVSAIVEHGYAYLYTVLDDSAHKDHPMILTRVPLSRLDSPEESIEHLKRDGSWENGLAWEDAAVVMEKGAAEMSVRYHPAQNTWVALQGKPDFLSPEVVVRTSPDLAGPWSAPRTIFSFPEKLVGSARFDKDTFCYAAKEQSQFSTTPDNIVFTYACNSFNFGKQVADMTLYRPRLATVPLDAPIK